MAETTSSVRTPSLLKNKTIGLSNGGAYILNKLGGSFLQW